MKTYKSHKVVEAAKIITAERLAGGMRLGIGPGPLDFIDVDDTWLVRHGMNSPTDLLGGYAVSYPDSYLSWSPAEAFEEGYTEHSLDPKDGALPVAGYKPQTQVKVDCVNAMKVREELILQQLDHMAKDPEVDGRWLAIGRTHLEEAFMFINRSIFRPGRVVLAERDTFETRLRAEFNDLSDRHDKLNAFLASDGFAKVSETQRALLLAQADCMGLYREALRQRLVDLAGEG